MRFPIAEAERAQGLRLPLPAGNGANDGADQLSVANGDDANSGVGQVPSGSTPVPDAVENAE